MSNSLAPELVKEFVYNAHSDFDKIKEMLDLLGPHTIPLMAHAKAGGDHSINVVQYLESIK